MEGIHTCKKILFCLCLSIAVVRPSHTHRLREFMACITEGLCMPCLQTWQDVLSNNPTMVLLTFTRLCSSLCTGFLDPLSPCGCEMAAAAIGLSSQHYRDFLSQQ